MGTPLFANVCPYFFVKKLSRFDCLGTVSKKEFLMLARIFLPDFFG